MICSTPADPRNLQGPGLAKSNPRGIWARRQAIFLQSIDGRWKDLFAVADTVTEGAVRIEKEGPVWYGSTSIILSVPFTNDEDYRLLVAVASHDPHVRLRAVRTAHREATLRAPAELESLRSELRFLRQPSGLRIDVDLHAPLVGHYLRIPRTENGIR